MKFPVSIISLAIFIYMPTWSVGAADAAPSPSPDVKSAAELPPGILMKKRAPVNLKWEIIFFKPAGVQTGNEAPEKPTLIPGHKITVYKTPTFLYEEETTGDEVFFRWYRGKTEIIRDGLGKPFVPISANERVPGMPKVSGKFGKSDFAGFDWITRAKFRGIRSLPMGDCLVFSDEIPLPHAFNEPAAAKFRVLKVVAWIDAKTRLPVRLRRGDEVRAFRFSVLHKPLELPPEVQRLFKTNEAAVPQGWSIQP